MSLRWWRLELLLELRGKRFWHLVMRAWSDDETAVSALIDHRYKSIVYTTCWGHLSVFYCTLYRHAEIKDRGDASCWRIWFCEAEGV